MKHKNGFKEGDFIRRENGKVVYQILTFGSYQGGDTRVLQTETNKIYTTFFYRSKYLLVDKNGNNLVKNSDLFPIY